MSRVSTALQRGVWARFADPNPVLVQELRGRMRGVRAFVVLTIFLLVLAVPTTLLYLAAAQSVQFDPFSAGQRIGKTVFLGIAAVALVQVLIIVPSQAASAIAGEKERETYDLLISTLLTPWQIVFGKLLAALAYATLLVVAVIPFMALSFLFGGVTGLEVVIALVGLLATALLFGSIGIFWSTVMRRSMAAIVVTLATIMFVLFGMPFLILISSWILLGFGPQPEWVNSGAFIYLWISLLSLHPFVALGTADAYFSTGETSLFFRADQNAMPPFILSASPDPVWVPHPWVLFVLQAVVISAILISLSVRQIKPQKE
jgi:ABC-2 type transport system permease protein